MTGRADSLPQRTTFMTTPTHVTIRGLGIHLPERVLSNADLERMVETNDEWIVSRTGIRTRRIAAEGEGASDLAVPAAHRALKQAGMTPDDVTHILFASLSPDSYTPQASCLLAHKLGIAGRMALDVNAACAGFLYAMEMARGLVALHPEAVVLVACAEALSSRVNWSDRSTCVLFGDGAGVCVVTARPEDGPATPAVLDVLLKSDGAASEFLTIKGGGSARPYKLGEPVTEDFFLQMQGPDVFKWAVKSMSAVCNELLTRHGLGIDDVDFVLTHQANLRIIEAVGKKLKVPTEKVFINVDKYGNTSAASIPIALSEALESGFVKPGQLGLFATFGGGFTWGAALMRF